MVFDDDPTSIAVPARGSGEAVRSFLNGASEHSDQRRRVGPDPVQVLGTVAVQHRRRGYLGVPYSFKEACTSFKPPRGLSEEAIQKYLRSRLSDDPEAIDKAMRLREGRADAIGRSWPRIFFEGADDADPVAGVCNE